LGKPILLMILAAFVSGGVIATRQPTRKKDLVLWTFTDLHAETYRSIIPEFERMTGKTVDIQLINGRALPARLEAMFMGDVRGGPLPDLVEIEIGWVGRFFRPPVDDVGLLPLNELLARSGWDQRIVPGRFAPWSKEGIIFGVPHDVHPVTITYRKDLFDEAGVDLESATTWSEFREKCLAFRQYWQQRGYFHRHAIELPRASADYVIVMLLQRGINVIDERERITLTDDRVAKTIAFYAQLVAGPKKIASEAVNTPSGSGTGLWINDVLAGNLCSFVTPDWRITGLKMYAPQLAGKLRMMPLPRFEPTDEPTGTWGGTMIGIPRNSRKHEDAWRLLEFLYLSETGLKARQKTSDILPPVIAQWNDPAYHDPDPYFGGQRVDELYVELGRAIPPRYVTPATTIAQVQLSVVLSRAVQHVEQHGEAGLDEQIRAWLDEAAHDLRRRIAHGKMEQ
jgi:arabinosaccharide transport system substrate-binding protein